MGVEKDPDEAIGLLVDIVGLANALRAYITGMER